jgi:DnaD/phage-associated family protein
MSYIVRTALSICDDGITTYEQLERYFAERERAETSSEEFRKLCGFGSRSFSAKERAYVTKWFEEFCLPFSLVREAYDTMINAIHEIRLPYMDKILTEWHEKGYTDPEEASKQRQNGKKPVQGMQSFDINELFDAAVKKGMDN